MAREPRQIDPRLEAWLDERDHLRIKINVAEGSAEHGEPLALLRRRLVEVDHMIIKQWGRDA